LLSDSHNNSLQILQNSVLDLLQFFTQNDISFFGNGVLLDHLMDILKTLLIIPGLQFSEKLLDLEIFTTLYSKFKSNNDFCKNFIYLLDSVYYHIISKKEPLSDPIRIQFSRFFVNVLLNFSQWQVIGPLRYAVSDSLNSLSKDIMFLLINDKASFLKIFEIFLYLSQDESQMIRMNVHSNILWMINHWWSYEEFSDIQLNEKEPDSLLETKINSKSNNSPQVAQMLNEMISEKDNALTINSTIGLKSIFLLFMKLILEHVDITQNVDILFDSIVMLGGNILTKYLIVNKKNYIDKGIDYFFLPDKVNKFEELVYEQIHAIKIIKSILQTLQKKCKKDVLKKRREAICEELLCKFRKCVSQVFGDDQEYIDQLGLNLNMKDIAIPIYDEKDALIATSREFWNLMTNPQ
jgi:hypothetical protein